MMPLLHRLFYSASLALAVLTVACNGGSETAEPAQRFSGGLSPTPAVILTPPPTRTPLPEHAPTGTPSPTVAPLPEHAPAGTPSPTVAPVPAGKMTAEQLYKQVSPSVAFVQTPMGAGSGFLIEGGYVVTNHHVVWPWEKARVAFPDGPEILAPVAAWDPMSDIALLGPVAAPVPPLGFGDGENLPIGSQVYLLGYPGETESSPGVTILSGLLSHYRQWDRLGMTYLQTDTVIAGGQSGSPLLNSKGEVIGITVFKFTEASYALAASAADLEPLVQRLIQGRDPSGVGNRRFGRQQPGNEFRGDLQNPWDSRTFLMELATGDVVEIEIACANPVRFKVTDLAENILLDVANSPGGVAQGSAEARMDGHHFLTVETPAHSSSCFELTANVPMSPFTDPDDGQRLNLGDTIGGNVDHPGDRDWYSIRLEEGELLKISADSLNIDTVLSVDFPKSRINQVVQDDDSGGGLFEANAELVYRVPVTGEYFIIVEEFSGWDSGGYLLSVDRASSGTETAAVPPSPLEVDSPFGKMIVFESQLSDFSVQVPAEWVEMYPDDQPPHFTFYAANTADGERGSVGILEFDLAAFDEKQTLEELVDSILEESSGSSIEIRRENILTSSGDPGVALEFQLGVEPDELAAMRMLVSIQDERFAFVVLYGFTKDGFQRALTEYSFNTLHSSGDGDTPTPADGNSLAALYNATDGRNWRNNNGWLSDQPIGQWYGVVTNADGRVVGLQLDENRLSGEIPATLGRLSDLELLDLSNNRLGGALPEELGSLTNLKSLFLNGNDLTGAIPPELSHLPGLEILHLHFNNFTGDIPSELGDLAMLRELDLGVNDLSGEIPPELGNLSNLTSLWLGWNDLSGEIPPELADLGNLTRLWVNNNRLEGCVPDSLASQLDDQSNVGDLSNCGDKPLATAEREDVDAPRGGGPGAVYAGDLTQLVGPAPSIDLGDRDGNVTLGSIEQFARLFESAYYRQLLERANPTDPTPLTSSGHSIEIHYACINRALPSCRLVEEFWAPNLEKRTNGQLRMAITSLAETGLAATDTLELVSDGTLEMIAVYSGYVGGELPIFGILNLYGHYSDHRTLFESTTEMLPTLDAVLAQETRGGMVINHNWFLDDVFLFGPAPLRSVADFEGMKIRSRSSPISDWLGGMGARPEFVPFAEVYDALKQGRLDAGATSLWSAYGQRWYEVTRYMNGPLVRWVPLPNLVNPDVWERMPSDLQRILIEEGARAELEQFRLAPDQALAGVQNHVDAGMEAIEFTPELTEHSFNVALMQHVIPGWLRQLGYPGRGAAAVTLFNDSVGPYVGLRIEPGGTVAKRPIAKGPNSDEMRETDSVAASPPAPSWKDLSDAETAHMWIYMWMYDNGIGNTWIRASAQSGFFMDGSSLDVSVRFGRQAVVFCNGGPMHQGEVEPLDHCGEPEERALANITGLFAATPEGPMRCQRHQSSTNDDLTYACILEDETAHPRIVPHPPNPATLPTPSPEELSDADTADLWAYLWMGGSDGRQVRATAEAGFFMDQYQLELRVHFGRRYEAFCNGSPLHIDELMVLDCGYPEQSLDDVSGVSARTPDGPMRCNRHQTSVHDELAFACMLQGR